MIIRGSAYEVRPCRVFAVQLCFIVGQRAVVTDVADAVSRYVVGGATQHVDAEQPHGVIQCAASAVGARSRFAVDLPGVEVALATIMADKTNWRAILKGNNVDIDLKTKAAEAIPAITEALAEIKDRFGDNAVEALEADPVSISYPVTEYPQKISSLNFDKNPHVEGILQGIKGQYLIFDTGVINVRKFTGYEITAAY